MNLFPNNGWYLLRKTMSAFSTFAVAVLALSMTAEAQLGKSSATKMTHPELPRPLSDFDVAQYKRLFHLQEVGRMKQATREMGRLEDNILVGRLLSQRYLHPNAWRSTYTELSRWLAAYNDHPRASRIYWLAKKRRPKGQAMPNAPKSPDPI